MHLPLHNDQHNVIGIMGSLHLFEDTSHLDLSQLNRIRVCRLFCPTYRIGGSQCRINNGANGAAAPGPPQLGAPHN